MKTHDQVTFSGAQHCYLYPPLALEQLSKIRILAERNLAPVTAPIGVLIGVKKVATDVLLSALELHRDCTTDCTTTALPIALESVTGCTDDCTEKEPEHFKNADDRSRLNVENGVISGDLAFKSHSSLGEPSEPCELENQKSEEETELPCALRSFLSDDLTMTKTSKQGVTRRVRDLNFEQMPDTDLLERLSDGELNQESTAVTDYPEYGYLIEACRQAARELAATPFQSRSDCARLMGKVMSLLRDQYGANAPKCWVPVLKILRVGGTLTVDSRPDYGQRIVNERREVSPDSVVTDSWSAVCAADRDGNLLKASKEDSTLGDVLSGTAQTWGVPNNWREGLLYVRAVVAALKGRQLVVPKTLASIEQYLQDRVDELDQNAVSVSLSYAYEALARLSVATAA